LIVLAKNFFGEHWYQRLNACCKALCSENPSLQSISRALICLLCSNMPVLKSLLYKDEDINPNLIGEMDLLITKE